MGSLPTGAVAPVILVACLAAVVLSVWLPVAATRRWVPPRWRALTASVGAAVVLALTVWLTVLSFTTFAPAG
jgi:TRAP-type C4-dicarboxylate transport system permease small subunit